MRNAFSGIGHDLRGLAFVSLVAAIGCAYPVVPTVVAVRPAVPVSAPGDSLADKTTLPPVVEVRTYSISPTISVVAWEPDNSMYGLRTWIPRHGEPLAKESRQTTTDSISRRRLSWKRVVRAAPPRPHRNYDRRR